MPTRSDLNKSASFASVNAALRALGFKASDLTFKKSRGYTGYLTGEDVAHAEGGSIPIYSTPIETSSVGGWVREILFRVEQDGQFSPSDETFARIDHARARLDRVMGVRSNPRRRSAAPSRRRNPSEASDDVRGSRLAFALNSLLDGKARFDDVGNGTLVNTSLVPYDAVRGGRGELNITIRSGKAVVSVRRTKAGGFANDYEIGTFKWDDVDGILALLREEFPALRRTNPRRRSAAPSRRRNPEPRYTLLGVDDEVTVCEHCGKANLKCTVVLGVLDADGNVEREARFGRSCAAKALRKRSTMTANKMESLAREAEYQRAWNMRVGHGVSEKITAGRIPIYVTSYPLEDGRTLLVSGQAISPPRGTWTRLGEGRFVGHPAKSNPRRRTASRRR